MSDPRVLSLAKLLVNHSVKVQRGERVLIRGGFDAAPLLTEVYRETLRAGGRPRMLPMLPGAERILIDEAGPEQYEDIEFGMYLYENCECLISIRAPRNSREMTGADQDKIRAMRKAAQPMSKIIMEDRIRWVGTVFPCASLAQEAEMSEEDYADFVFNATNADYAALRREMEGPCARFDAAKKVRITGKGTDITIDIEGRTGEVCAGSHNVPDGEFFYTPNHHLTEGVIEYDCPAIVSGQEVSGIRLVFKEGRVVEAHADRGSEYLHQALDMDEGARALGELGIGCNAGIQRPVRDILFDEKIGGSVHLALGAAYTRNGEAPGNVSALHWDMVKRLHDGGEIHLDGAAVQKNGKWLL